MSEVVKNPKRGRRVVVESYTPEYQRLNKEPIIMDKTPVVSTPNKIPKQLKVNIGQNEDWVEPKNILDAHIDNSKISEEEITKDINSSEKRKQEINNILNSEVSVEELIQENQEIDQKTNEVSGFDIDVGSFLLLFRNDLIAIGSVDEIKETLIKKVSAGFDINDFMILKRVAFSLNLNIVE